MKLSVNLLLKTWSNLTHFLQSVLHLITWKLVTLWAFLSLKIIFYVWIYAHEIERWMVNCKCFTIKQTLSLSGPAMAPSWLCPPQTVTAPSCHSLPGSWALHWKSRPPWRSLSQAVVLRKKARRHHWPKAHLLYPSRHPRPHLPHPKLTRAKTPPL